MPDIKISALPAAGAIVGTELVPIVQGGVTVHATTNQIVHQTTLPAKFGILDVVSQIILENPDNPGLPCTFDVASTAPGPSNRLEISNPVAINGGVRIGGGLALNGVTTIPGIATVNAASVDLASVIALCNQLRAALIANGTCQ